MDDKKIIFDLDNECQVHGAQHPPPVHSMANIQIYKGNYTVLRYLSPFPILPFQIFYFEKLGHGSGVQHSQRSPFFGEYRTL